MIYMKKKATVEISKFIKINNKIYPQEDCIVKFGNINFILKKERPIPLEFMEYIENK